MFCEANRDVTRHIISFLPLEDWVSIQKTATVFRSSQNEILERKRLYFNDRMKVASGPFESNPNTSMRIKGTIALFKALIKHVDLFKLLLSSVHSQGFQKYLAATKETCTINLQYAESVVMEDEDKDIMRRVLLEWKEIEASVDAVVMDAKVCV